MFPWLKRPLQEGWVTVVPHDQTAQILHLVWPTGGRPTLQWAGRLAWTDPADSMLQLRQQHQLQRYAHRSVVLQRHQYQLLSVDAPDVPRESWADAVRWQIKDLINFPIESAQVDLLEIPADTNQRGRPSVLVAVASHKELSPLANAAMGAKTPWEVIDLPETSLRNVAALLEEPGRGIAVLQVEDDHSMLVITSAGELLQSRTFDVNFQQLTDSDPAQRQQAFDRAGLELQRTLDSFERLFSRVTLSRLVISIATEDEQFIDYIRELLYVPVVRLNITDCIDFSLTQWSGGLTVDTVSRVALGAALRPS